MPVEPYACYAYCKPSYKGWGRLSIPTVERARDTVTVYLHSTAEGLEVKGPLSTVLNPDPYLNYDDDDDDDDESRVRKPPALAYDALADCHTSTFEVPSETRSLTWTVQIGAELVTFTAERARETAVFVVYTNLSAESAYDAWVKAAWGLHGTGPGGEALLAAHGQLLLAFPSVPAFSDAVATLAAVHETHVNARSRGDAEGGDTRALAVLGQAGQLLERLSWVVEEPFDLKDREAARARQPNEYAQVTSEAAAALWSVAGRAFLPTSLEAWRKRHRKSAPFSRNAVKWLYNFDRQAFVATFRFVSLSEVLAALGDRDFEAGLMGLPLKEHALRKTDLPDFKPPATAKDLDDANISVVAHANAGVDWGGLERSETLEQREAQWDRAVKGALATLHRLWYSRKVLRDERAWMERILLGAAAARGGVEAPQWRTLTESFEKGRDALAGVADSVRLLENLDLKRQATELAATGQGLRMQTRRLVDEYGAYVGSANSGVEFGISTLTERPAPGADAKVVPQLATSCSAVLSNGNILVTETGMNRISLFNHTTMKTIVIAGTEGAGYLDGLCYNPAVLPDGSKPPVAALRAPGAICRLSDTSFYVADTGNSLIRHLSHGENGWTLETVAGQQGVRGLTDGAGRMAMFSNIRGLLNVVPRRGMPFVVVADGQRLRRLTGGLNSCAVRSITREGGGKAETFSPKAMAYDAETDTFYFTDAHALRCIRSFAALTGPATTVTTIHGAVKQAGPRQSGRFNAPSGLFFTRVPRLVPLDDDDDDEDEKKKDAKDDKGGKGAKDKDKSAKDKGNSAGQTPAEIEKERRLRLHRKFVPVLLVSDTTNHSIRAISSTRKAQTFSTIDDVVVLGRENGNQGWKDGIGTVSQLRAPTHLCARDNGDAVLCEHGRLRLIAPPQVLARAAVDYKKLGVRVEALAENLVQASRGSNVQSATLVETVRASRLGLLQARSTVEEAAYRKFAEGLLDPSAGARHTQQTLLCLVAVSPSIATLRWIVQAVLSSGLLSLEDSFSREHTLSSDQFNTELPQSLSNIERPPGLADAVDEAIGRLSWPPSAEQQRRLLGDLTSLAEDVPGAVGTVALESVLTRRGFRVPPCLELLRFVRATIGSLADLAESTRKALATWATAAVPRDDGTTGRLPPKKQFRGVVRLFADFYDDGEVARCNGDEGLLGLARNACRVCLQDLVGTEASAEALSVWLGYGLSNVLYEDTGADDVDVLTYAVPVLPTEVAELLKEVSDGAFAAMGAEEIFGNLFNPTEQQWLDAMGKRAQDDDEGGKPPTKQDSTFIYHALNVRVRACDVLRDDGAATMTLDTLLGAPTRTLWPALLPWYAKARSRDMNASGKEWAALEEVCKAVGRVFVDGASRLRAHSLTVHSVRQLVQNKQHVLACFTTVGAKDAGTLIDQSQELSQRATSIVNSAEAAASTFYEHHPLGTYVHRLQQGWNRLRFSDALSVTGLLQSVLPEGHAPHELSPGLRDLPAEFLRAVRWLENMCGQALFHWAWDTAAVAGDEPAAAAEVTPPAAAPVPKEDDGCDEEAAEAEAAAAAEAEVSFDDEAVGARIVRAVRAFCDFGDRFRARVLTFRQISEANEYLRPELLCELPPLRSGPPTRNQTVHHFCRAMKAFQTQKAEQEAAAKAKATADGEKTEDMPEDVSGYPVPTDQIEAAFSSLVSRIFTSLDSFFTLKGQKEVLLEKLELLGAYMSVGGRLTLSAAATGITSISTTLQELDIDAYTVDNFSDLEVHLSAIDPTLLTVSTKLLETLRDNRPLLDFVANHHSDQNFTSAVEMAMGRPEMECPPELWVCDGDGPGHPNEEVLSKLTGVRRTLHKLLYGPTGMVRRSLRDVTAAFRGLSEDAQLATAATVAELGLLRLPLEELVSGGGEASAVGRLKNLYLPAWEAHWQLRGAQRSAGVEVTLEYLVVSESKKVASSQTVDGLLDFQSAVVLAKGSEVADLVQDFVAQFGWVRELGAEYDRMKVGWHPARQDFVTRIPLQTPPEQIRAQVAEAKRELSTWEDEVSQARGRFPQLNTVTLGQLLRLADALATAEGDGEEGDDAAEAKQKVLAPVVDELRRSIFPRASEEDLQAFLADVWGGGSSGRSRDSFLSQVDMMMNVSPPEWLGFPERPIGVAASGASSLSKGVQVMVVDGQDMVKAMLSAHLQAGVLPEWHRVLWVTQRTTLELIRNALLRWAHAEEDGDEAAARLFVLAGVENIDEGFYHAVVTLFMELEPGARNALLVLSNTRDHYVVRQLAPWRTASLLLPDEELEKVGVALAGEEQRVVVYGSPHSGSGKTFALRTAAAGRPLVYLPMQRNLSPAELVGKLEETVRRTPSATAGYVLHLELSETVTEMSSVLLFELLFLGSVYDPVKGQRWFLPGTAAVCVEAAPGTERLPVLSMLNSVTPVATKDTFCYDGAALREGMGRAFVSKRHDGTSFGGFGVGVNAHERLRWVVYAINAVDRYDLICEHKSLTPTSGADYVLDATCYSTLCRAANLREPVSLWALWSFVDVLFWLLRGTFHERSDVAQMLWRLPSNIMQRGRNKQASMRAETFDFVCRTAADFATRQKRIVGDELGWLEVETTTRHTDGSVAGRDRHYYRRCNFRSNGQPVFRMGTFFDPTFIHYQAGDRRWVMSAEVGANCTVLAGGQADGTLLQAWTGGPVQYAMRVLTLDELAKVKPVIDSTMRNDENLRAADLSEPLGDLKEWNEANHEALLVSASTGLMAVLAVNNIALKKRMHPQLLEMFEANDVNVGSADVPHHEVLSALTNVQRTEREAAKLLEGTYCMTRDVVLKILAVFVRVRCGVPVILMGECGCGKTHMLRYVCAWLNAELLILDVHGGTTEKDILGIFVQADKLLARQKEVYVFLDEVNTCTHMGLISEIIVGRTLFGVALNSKIHVLAACNPYRKRKNMEVSTGLAYQAPNRDDLFVDELRDLVYRVHPIPKRMQEYIFDFGSLSASVEESYVKAMVAAQINDPDVRVVSGISKMLIKAQTYVREVEGDPSVVSLRDLKRALRLAKWFKKFGGKKAEPGRSVWGAPALLGIVHVFYFRLSSADQRAQLLERMRIGVRRYGTDDVDPLAFLTEPGQMQKLIKGTMNALCGKLEVEDGIAMNQSLKENLYVTMISIFNRVPIFVVGKPGSSKTLTLQVLASNLQGEQSPSKFWARFPALYIFPYQCSPLSTAAGIKHQFDIACSYQKKATKTIVILLLDEVGLAEHSPDMPLKVLHGILVDPPISIVGLSNWTLDAAKMNRAICLQRPEPASDDIHLTGEHILGSGHSRSLLTKLSEAYHSVYTTQSDRAFIGMRDFYQTLKLLKREQKYLPAGACVVLGMQFLVYDPSCVANVRPSAREGDLLTIVRIDTEKEGDTRKVVENGTEYTEVAMVAIPTGAQPVTFFEADAGLSLTTADVTELVRSGVVVPLRVLSTTQLEAYTDAPALLTPHDPVGAMNEARNRRSADARGINSHMLAYALLRNFGGNRDVVRKVCKVFGHQCYNDETAISRRALTPIRLIAANLCDASSRHLMVLTNNGAALPLLFDTGLMDANQTEVLVGSTFRDDDHELHLVQQVNRVKAAMAMGTAVVLHNHDSIYESLYDVLNQRYVTSTVLASGKEQKMLRLAIGSRSQLCPVEDGFRIVVVAEQSHADNNLDLPLLNRFEKQSLDFSDCLTPEQLELCRVLDAWCTEVLAETMFEEVSHIFCGYGSDTVSSLVFSNAEKTEGELRTVLARLALPVAAMQSQLLSEALPAYEDEHCGLASLVLNDSVMTQKCNLVIVATRSPVEQATIGKLCAEPTDAAAWETVRLSEIGSESVLTGRVTEFYKSACVSGQKRVLIVQCDPMTSSQATIEHARRTAQRVKHCAASPGDAHVVLFLVHLPPGVRHCDRVYHANFYKEWDMFFLDDVAEPDMDDPTSLLLHRPLLELVRSGHIDIVQRIRKKTTSALSLLRQPSARFHECARHLTKLLESSDRLVQLVQTLFERVLEKRCPPSSTGLPHLVELAMGEHSAGSLRVSLRYVLELVVVQVSSHIFRALNADGALLSLNDKTADLWFRLQALSFGEKAFFDSCEVGGLATFLDVENTGLLAPLACKFPFSAYVMRVNDAARAPILEELRCGNVDYARLAKTCDAMHDADVVKAWQAAFPDHSAYLHDFVVSRTKVLPGLPTDAAVSIHEAVIKMTDPSVLSNPLAIHAAFWKNETTLFFLGSLASAVPPQTRAAVLAAVEGCASCDDVGRTAVDACAASLVATLSETQDLAVWREWCQRGMETVALDAESLQAGHAGMRSLVLATRLVTEVVLPATAQQHEMLAAYVRPALALRAPYTIAALRDVLAGCDPADAARQDAFLVTYLREFSHGDNGAAEVPDVLRLACGLRPKIWPGAAACADGTRRGLLHTLVERLGMAAVVGLAEEVRMGPKYTEALNTMLFEFLQDVGASGPAPAGSEQDLNAAETALLLSIPEKGVYGYDLLLALSKAKRAASCFADSCAAYLEAVRDDERAAGPFVPPSKAVRVALDKVPGMAACVLRDVAGSGGMGRVTSLLQCKPLGFFVDFNQEFMLSIKDSEMLPDVGAALLAAPTTAEAHATEQRVLGCKKVVAEALARSGDAAKRDAARTFMAREDVTPEFKLSVLFSMRTQGERMNETEGDAAMREWLTMRSVVRGQKYAAQMLAMGGWGEKGTHASEGFRWGWTHQATSNERQAIHALVFQLALALPTTLRGTYLEDLAKNPRSFKREFVPSMEQGSAEDREQTEVFATMAKGSYLTWYTCPNGHLYSIGECGGAMEYGVCSHPGCSARIGGQNHASAKGNTMVGGSQELLEKLTKNRKNADQKDTRGYTPTNDFAPARGVVAFISVNRMDSIACAVLRFWFFACITLSQMTSGDESALELHAKLTRRHVHNNLALSYSRLKAYTKMSDTELLLCMYYTLDKAAVPVLTQAKKTRFTSKEKTMQFENALSPVLQNVFRNPRAPLAHMQKLVGTTTVEANLRRAMREQDFDDVFVKPTLGVWTPRPSVSVDHFKAFFNRSPANNKAHPLLAAVCQNEARLDIIKHLADMLELQAALFDALRGAGLRRVDAAETPALDVVEGIKDPAARARALSALRGYCAVFNKAMPMLPNLFECQRNPFLNSADEVDLSGGGALHREPMSPDAPVAFSLPSMVPGEVDAAGLCSIQLGGMLSRVHNNVVRQLAGLMPHVRPVGGDADADAPAGVISISQATPAEVVRRALISYDRERDLLPLLYRHQFETEGQLGYDVAAIELELAARTLRGKVPVQLEMEHFAFAGEVRQRGFLATLNNFEQAAALPSAIEAALSEEVTTKQQVARILRLLEHVIHFFVAIGATVPASTKLRAFCLDVMNLAGGEEELRRCLVPAVCEHGRVSHLKALYLFVESMSDGGSLMQNVSVKYTRPLEEEGEMQLRRAVGYMQHSHLVAAMRDLLTGPLSAAEVNFPEDECLKDYIGYADMDVGNSMWFEEHFPEDLELKHALAAYDLLNAIALKK